MHLYLVIGALIFYLMEYKPINIALPQEVIDKLDEVLTEARGNKKRFGRKNFIGAILKEVVNDEELLNKLIEIIKED